MIFPDFYPPLSWPSNDRETGWTLQFVKLNNFQYLQILFNIMFNTVELMMNCAGVLKPAGNVGGILSGKVRDLIRD
jgi:hypothetical protein